VSERDRRTGARSVTACCALLLLAACSDSSGVSVVITGEPETIFD
jgi:hypothetical protein